MPFEFKLPDVGEGIAEGQIIKWLVKEGDKVKEDQAIVQVETDKAVVDLPAPRSGTILKINYREGQTVKVGSTLVVIGESGEKVKESKPEKVPEREEKKTSTKGQSVVGTLEEAREEKTEVKTVNLLMRGVNVSEKVLASPLIRRMAHEQGIDLTKIKGSGKDGEITRKDIDVSAPEYKAPEQKIQVTTYSTDQGKLERIPLKGIRKTIAVNMMRSLQESAQLTMMEDINITQLYKIREKEKKSAEKKGIKLNLLPFILKAVISALKEHPVLNASIEGEDILLKKYYNIGIAVETDIGLVVPVIKDAEHKSILAVASEISQLAEKAKTRRLSIEEMRDSTFTITNYGSVGGTYATPIINPPESAILGLGRMFDRAVFNSKRKLENVRILPLSLSFDHRIVDGSQAARFMEKLKTYLEDPDHFMLEMD